MSRPRAYRPRRLPSVQPTWSAQSTTLRDIPVTQLRTVPTGATVVPDTTNPYPRLETQVPTNYRDELLSIREVAELAQRSVMTVHRWVREGWLTPVLVLPGYNGAALLDRHEVNAQLPFILEQMSTRRGGRGKTSPYADGSPRPKAGGR